MGRGLGVLEVALFIFMVFWGWVLGDQKAENSSFE